MARFGKRRRKFRRQRKGVARLRKGVKARNPYADRVGNRW